MMLRPWASNVLARTRTSNALSTPSRLILSASLVMDSGLSLSEKRNAVAEIRKHDAIADDYALAVNARGQAPARIEGNDRNLVGRFMDVRLRRGPHYGLRVDFTVARTWSGLLQLRFGNRCCGGHHQAALKTVTTAVAPEPPRFWARPSECFLICRSPASPRS